MQEEVENRTINLASTTSKLTVRERVSGVKAYLRYVEQKKRDASYEDDTVRGKQTVKELVQKDQGVTSIPIGDKRLKDFDHIAAKYGVDYAVIKDKNEIPAKYTVFFKARDTDILNEIVKEYAAKELMREQRPSVRAVLKELREKLAGVPAKARHKEQEHSL